MVASLWKTWRASCSASGLAPSAASAFWDSGTCFSHPRAVPGFRPALRKYFCAMMSVAIWLQVEGTMTPSILKTDEPLVFLISLVRDAQTIPS